MVKKPGLRTKEGLQVSGIYLLVAVGVLQYIFPDIEAQDIQAVVQWYHEQDLNYSSMLQHVWNGSVITYIGSRLRAGA